jgi:mRNA interferase MazF
VILRGQVYRSDLGYGAKPWLVISNNKRNALLNSIIAVRITTTVKDLPTWVPLTRADPITGYVNTDDIQQLYIDELGDELGTLSRQTMLNVNRALSLALSLLT